MDPDETTPEPATITTRTPDYGNAEINAMAIIVAALDGIDEEAHGRVLRWVASRCGLET